MTVSPNVFRSLMILGSIQITFGSLSFAGLLFSIGTLPLQVLQPLTVLQPLHGSVKALLLQNALDGVFRAPLLLAAGIVGLLVGKRRDEGDDCLAIFSIFLCVISLLSSAAGFVLVLVLIVSLRDFLEDFVVAIFGVALVFLAFECAVSVAQTVYSSKVVCHPRTARQPLNETAQAAALQAGPVLLESQHLPAYQDQDIKSHVL